MLLQHRLTHAEEHDDRRAAKRDGVSLNRFINTALAEKVAALEAEEIFTRHGPIARAFPTCWSGSEASPRIRGPTGLSAQ